MSWPERREAKKLRGLWAWRHGLFSSTPAAEAIAGSSLHSLQFAKQRWRGEVVAGGEREVKKLGGLCVWRGGLDGRDRTSLAAGTGGRSHRRHLQFRPAHLAETTPIQGFICKIMEKYLTKDPYFGSNILHTSPSFASMRIPWRMEAAEAGTRRRRMGRWIREDRSIRRLGSRRQLPRSRPRRFRWRHLVLGRDWWKGLSW